MHEQFGGVYWQNAVNVSEPINNTYVRLFRDLADSVYKIKKFGGTIEPFTGGSAAPAIPIVRYIYLLQDASDIALMGGNINHVYGTFQTAYNAANTLQVLLGGANRVVIQVGNTTAAIVGDLTLTANWNNSIDITGISPHVSQVGNIVATNAAGSGFNLGASFGTSLFRAYNITIGNISTNATGVVGSSGRVFAIVGNTIIGNIDTSITNAANVTGNGGGVSFLSTGSPLNISYNFVCANITTSSKATTSSAGSINISGTTFSIANIITCSNNAGGSINIQSSSFSSGRIATISHNCTNNGGSVNILNSAGNNWSFNFQVLTTGANIISECSIPNLTITSTVAVNASILKTIIGSYTSNTNITSILRHCLLDQILNLGTNSRLMLCTIACVAGGVPAISGIATGCKIMNCTIEHGTFGIDNSIPVVVDINVNSTYIENGVGVNITLI